MDKKFLKKLWITEDELLNIVRTEREEWEEFSNDFKLEIEADLKLLKNKRDKKKDERLVGDSTLFNNHTALVARSYQAINTIKFKWDKNWVEREIKMLNEALNEDMNSAYEKAQKYYLYYDKYATWISIKARIGWDWVYKRNITQIINPLTWVMDPTWDYFTWIYKYTGFYSIESKEVLKEQWYDVDNLLKQYSEWAIEVKERMQRILGLFPDYFSQDRVDIYTHFTTINGIKCRIKTANLDSYILDWWLIEPNSLLEEKNPEAISFPFAFYYWKPDRDNPFWDRPANYTRDVQLQKAEIANLRLNKMRAELYPMYLYNSDLVKGSDLNFWFNKWIWVKMWMWWEQFNINNVLAPIQKDLRVDTSFQVEASLDRQVEKSTSIWEVVQWTTPDKRETLGTNQLIQTNTDVNLSLNEEIHSIWDEQWIKIWFGWYYQNFAEWDKKLVYAWWSTAWIPINLKRKDFIYEWNLNLSIETNIRSQERKKRELNSAMAISPLISPTLNEASKLQLNRFIADRAWMPQETIEEILIDTPQMTQQKLENEALKLNIFVPIWVNDDHEQHLIALGNSINTEAYETHKMAHIEAFAKQWQQAPQQTTQEAGLNENAMMNSMASQSMSSANAQLQKA